MTRILPRYLQRMIRQGEVGQTIVIMALGFIVLLAFVGIVTDVSLMFVRYSTLRRAVDSAAVAAAGQMRRSAPTNDELIKASNEFPSDPARAEERALGYAYARNFATVNLAARQFIGMYGLSPTTVTVDTCLTMPGDRELCPTDGQQRKLVRVTAQVESPTVFLRLIGWGNITLEASAISETAVLDVVMIFSVGESMLNQTSYDDWAAAGYPFRYAPPRLLQSYGPVKSVYEKVGGDYRQLLIDLLTTKTHNSLNMYNGSSANPYQVRAFAVDASNNPTEITNWSDPRHTRAECRVRFFPIGQAFSIPNGEGDYVPADDFRKELARFYGLSDYASTWDSFVSAYNFYGCCNDPNGDGDFSDLVCQPFRKVRDASEKFLQRIDFVRGDRVAFVTFDRSAYVVMPVNAPGTADDVNFPKMMDNQVKALETLQKAVGVRAEPNFYADTDSDGMWDAFVTGGSEYIAGNPNSGIPITYDRAGTPGSALPSSGNNRGFNTAPLGSFMDYPVKDNCPFQNATLQWPFSMFSSPDQATATAWGLTYNSQRFPNPLASNTAPIMHPNFNDPAWAMLLPRDASGNIRADFPKAIYSYEYRGACRSSNVGAALRMGNNALLDPQTVRTNGAVWVMVMLGDGAAGASDPVVNTALRGVNAQGDPNPLVMPKPYYTTSIADNPSAGDYGVLGLCPTGTPSNRGELTSDWNDVAFPYCSDEQYWTRHFCFDPNNRDTKGNVYVDLAEPGCDPLYDVDDYARDWADFVGLVEPYPWLTVGRTEARSDLQLPTIFTIGFGLDFRQGNNSCSDNMLDCLGEELLRYIADVGDNFQIDTDYQQDLRNDKAPNLVLNANEDWGQRGPCEGPILGGYTRPQDVPPASYNNLINPITSGSSCGNYYNAPDEKRLEQVFDEIASRMFTRLSR